MAQSAHCLLSAVGLRLVGVAPKGARWASRACYQNVKSKHERDKKKIDPKKLLIASRVKDTFHKNSLVTVFHYNDLNSLEWKHIRLKFEQNDVKIHVFPSKISSKALATTQFKNMIPLFCGSTAVAVRREGSPDSVGRLLTDAQKESKLFLVGGMVDKHLLTPKGLKAYSKIPTIESLRQELVCILNQNQVSLQQSLACPSQTLSNLLERVPDAVTLTS